MKEQSLFDHLKNLTNLKTPWSDTPEFTKNYNQFMINRFIGLQDEFLLFMNEINIMSNLPDEVHYNLLSTFLPKKFYYFKYISRSKKEDVKTINNIMKFFECNEKEANSILELLPDDYLKDIDKYYNSLK